MAPRSEWQRHISDTKKTRPLTTSNLKRKNGEPGGTRTRDHRIKSAMLYQLSYRPIDNLQGMSKLGAAFGVTAPAGCSAKNERSPWLFGLSCAPSNLLPFGFQNPS